METNVANIEELATRILGEHASDKTVKELVACLHHGNGMMRLGNTGQGLAVLNPISKIMAPGSEGFRPTILEVKTPPTPAKKMVGTTSYVGNFWRKIGDGRGLAQQRPEGNYKPWAPVATRSLAKVAMGGPIGPVMATSPDMHDPENSYEWCDLTSVPVGGVVYRVASGDGHIVLFQRVIAPPDIDRWVKVLGGSKCQADYGNAYEILQEIGMPYTADDNAGLPRPLAFSPAAVKAARATPVAMQPKQS